MSIRLGSLQYIPMFPRGFIVATSGDNFAT